MMTGTMCSHCLLLTNSKKYSEIFFMSILAPPILTLCNDMLAQHTGDIQSKKPQPHEDHLIYFATEVF